MKNYNVFKIFLRYLFEHLKCLLYFLIVLIIFVLILYLYNKNLEPLIYASILSVSIGLIFVILNFIQYLKKYITLDRLKIEIIHSIENLPKYDTLIEKSCFELIEIIYKDNMEFKYNINKNHCDTLDYYTMWVHQIKTPISAMRLLLQLDTSETSKELQNELFKVEQYVEMVLSYLRIDSTSTDFLIKSYNLNDIVKQSIRKYSKPLILKKISISLDISDCSIITDEKWVSFVIEQILSNSLKYTYTDGNIHIYEKDKRLYIQDNGIGISEEDLPRVFDKGFTGYNGRLNKKSTGIGLYLCKKILSKLNHSIQVKSTVDDGTTIIIDFNNYTNTKD